MAILVMVCVAQAVRSPWPLDHEVILLMGCIAMLVMQIGGQGRDERQWAGMQWRVIQ